MLDGDRLRTSLDPITGGSTIKAHYGLLRAELCWDKPMLCYLCRATFPRRATELLGSRILNEADLQELCRSAEENEEFKI